MRAERLHSLFDIQIKWIHFPLHPDTPSQGQTLEELFAGRNIDITASQSRLQQVMRHEGIPFGERTMTYNSRLAQELGSWADDVAAGSSIHRLLYEAYFVHDQNLASIDRLTEIAAQAGLPSNEARDVLESRRYKSQVDADWQRSRSLGITGVPTYLARDQVIIGAQSVDVLSSFLHDLGAPPQNQPD